MGKLSKAARDAARCVFRHDKIATAVAAHEIQCAIDSAVAAKQEQCARSVEGAYMYGDELAAEIRALPDVPDDS